MKIFTTKTKLLGLLIVFILSSCSKHDSFLSSTADKLQGQWKYEKVKFQKNLSFSCSDITTDYKDLVIEFKKDYSVTQTNLTTGEQAQGIWEVVTEWVYYTEEGQAIELLEGFLANPTTGDTEKLDWENIGVTKKKIKATENKDKGTYTYTLVKL